jgi:hypothetical protein
MSATAQTLTEQATQLRELVTRFKLGHDTARPAAHATPSRSARPVSKPKGKTAPAAAGRPSTNGHRGAHELDRLAPNTDDGFTEF